MIELGPKLPLRALAVGALGYLLSSTILIGVAVLLAAAGVTLGVASIGTPDVLRGLRRRRRRSR